MHYNPLHDQHLMRMLSFGCMMFFIGTGISYHSSITLIAILASVVFQFLENRANYHTSEGELNAKLALIHAGQPNLFQGQKADVYHLKRLGFTAEAILLYQKIHDVPFQQAKKFVRGIY